MSFRKYIKPIFHIVLFLCILALLEEIFAFCLDGSTQEIKIKYDLQESVRKGQRPDIVMIGNSTVSNGLVPEIFEMDLPDVDCAVNLATGSQSLMGTYYYLKDFLKEYPEVRSVLLGVTFDQLITQDLNQKKELLVYDRMVCPEIKAEYCSHFLQFEELPLLLKSYRYKDGIGSISSTVQSKISFLSTIADERLMGYCPDYDAVDETSNGGIWNIQWSEEDVREENQEYLNQIVSLCADRDVSLFIITMPISDASVYSNDSYPIAHEYLAQFAEQDHVQYWDLNLWKDRTTSGLNKKMSNWEHLTDPAARDISHLCAKLVSEYENGEKDTEFFSSIEEMRKSLKGILFLALSTELKENGDRIVNAQCITVNDIPAEFHYAVRTESGEVIDLNEDYTTAKTAVLPSELIKGKITLIVEARENDGREDYSRTYQIDVDTDHWEN